MKLYDRVRLTESVLAEPLGPSFAESRDPGDPGQLRFGTGATLPETLHLSIELGIKALIEAFGRPGTIREHDLCKLLALLAHGSDEGREAVFYLGRSFDSAVHVYGLLRGWGDCSRFESIQKYFRSTGRKEHYEAYRYNQPSMDSDLEELINSVWQRIDLRLHLEIVRTLIYSARYFECLLDPDVTYNPPPQMLESRIGGSYSRAFRAAELPKHGDVSPPGPTFSHEHQDWLQDAVRTNYRGEASEDSPKERAARALDEESKTNIALRYKLDLWRRMEPDQEELVPSLSDGYTLSDEFDIHAYVQSRNGTALGSVGQRRDGLWDAKPLYTGQRVVLSSREHAIRFVVERSTQLAHIFVNGQHLGEMYLVRYMGYDLKYVEGYPCGWDGSRYRFEFLRSHQFAIGDDIGFGFADKGNDEGEPEGIGGRVVDTEEHVVYVSDLWGMGWDGPSLRSLYGIRFPSGDRKDEERPHDG
ncbi:MAG: hypothetical protein OXD31_08520 [Chloroflexi bacterium]|nr:hypothetical protein [Chloroflexota bacterium]